VKFSASRERKAVKLMKNLKIAIGLDFLTSFSSIPQSQQKRVREFVEKFRNNPVSESINYEKIHNVKDKNVRTVRISDSYRAVVIHPEKGNILPQSSRSFTTQWTNGFITKDPVIENGAVKMDNKGKPKTKLNFHWDHLSSFRAGLYTANLITAFDGGDRDIVLEGTTSFWIIPYKILIALFLISSILIYGAISIARRLFTIIKNTVNKNKGLQ